MSIFDNNQDRENDEHTKNIYNYFLKTYGDFSPERAILFWQICWYN